MIISKELFLKATKPFNIILDDECIDKFDLYARLLIEWNKKFNLTAIIEPDEIVIKHFADSLSIMQYNNFKKGENFIDVGTGAGFPGIPLLIANEGLMGTLLDSTGKKMTFIDEVLKELDLIGGETLSARAEECGKNEKYREKYDYSTARAVTNLRDLSEYCLPLVKKNGCFISMKSGNADQEIVEAKKAITTLGGKIEKVYSFNLIDKSDRMLIFTKKISQTPTNFPRITSQIMKKPIV